MGLRRWPWVPADEFPENLIAEIAVFRKALSTGSRLIYSLEALMSRMV